MYHARVKFQVASLFDANIKGELLLKILLELFFECEHGLHITNILSWSLCSLAAINCKAKSVTKRKLLANSRHFHIRLII